MSKRTRTKSNAGRKDISLMTLLANEATGDSRKLLKKYGVEDAANYADLEVKLANLYFQSNDKLALEKEMAEIHPHKKWLLKYVAPPVEIKKEEVKVEVKPEEKKTNFEGGCAANPTCPMFQNFNGQFSRFNGSEQPRTTNPMDYIGIIGMVAVVGALFFIMSKAPKLN